MTTFQGFWHGPPLSLVHRVGLQSFISHGHAFELYAYSAIDAGSDIIMRDAGAVIDQDQIFYFNDLVGGVQTRDIAPFSDLFRLELLVRQGGWWCDVDTICLSAAVPDCSHAWTRDNPEVHPELVYNGLMAFPAGDPILQAACAKCANRRSNLQRRGALGAVLMSEVLRSFGLPLDVVLTPDTASPLRWIEIFQLWLPEFRDQIERRTAAALVLPVYWSFAKEVGIDFSVLPPKGSMMDEFFNKYCRDGRDDGPRYDSEEIRRRTKAWFASEREWAVPELMLSPSGRDALRWLRA